MASFLLLLFSLLSCVVFFLYIYIQYIIGPQKLPHRKFSLPPGRFGFPIVGETLDFFFKLKNGVLEKFITERMAKYSSKVFKTSILGEPTAIIYGVEGNKFLFSNEGKMVRAWKPNSMGKVFAKSGDAEESDKLFREITFPFLKAEALHKYVPLMDTIMKQHIESYWEDEKVLNVNDISSNYTYTIACRVLLCIEDLEKIESFSKRIDIIADGVIAPVLNFPGTKFYGAVKAAESLRKELIQGVIKQRKVDLLDKNNEVIKKDILSSLLLANYDNGEFMTEFDVASHLIGLVFGSTDTINSVLNFTMMYLAELPHVYDEVRKEQMEIAKTKKPNELLNWDDISKMRYSRNVMKEVMRVRPPSFGAFREVLTDIDYAGYTMPKGWKMAWTTNLTHKNEEYFPNPEKFDPSRFEGNGPPPYTFVPFGNGPRMCPGNEYARVVVLVFMHNVVTKFKWEKLIANEKIVYDPVPRPTEGMPIRLHAHMT